MAAPLLAVIGTVVGLGFLTARGRRVFARCIAWWVGDVLGVRRSHVESALSRAGIAEPASIATRMYRALAEHLLELLALPLDRRIAARVRLPAATLDRFAGRGVMILTAHTGNWDVVACGVARQRPLTVVTRRLRLRTFDALWRRIRLGARLRLAVEGEVTRTVMTALRRGELVAMMIDQVPARHRAVVSLPFLGAPAPVDLAPALLAMRARVPVVVAFPWRGPDGRHAVHVAEIIEPPEAASHAWALECMRRATDLLAAFVREQPEQWLWMHRRWWAHEDRASAARETVTAVS